MLTATIIEFNQGTILEGNVEYITTQNQMGRLDITDKHTNYITTIYGKLIIKPENGAPKEFQIKKGLLECKENNVKILVTI